MSLFLLLFLVKIAGGEGQALGSVLVLEPRSAGEWMGSLLQGLITSV